MKQIPHNKLSSNSVKNTSGPFINFNSFKGKNVADNKGHIKSIRKQLQLKNSPAKKEVTSIPKINKVSRPQQLEKEAKLPRDIHPSLGLLKGTNYLNNEASSTEIGQNKNVVKQIMIKTKIKSGSRQRYKGIRSKVLKIAKKHGFHSKHSKVGNQGMGNCQNNTRNNLNKKTISFNLQEDKSVEVEFPKFKIDKKRDGSRRNRSLLSKKRLMSPLMKET
jgi:hypothetical protein